MMEDSLPTTKFVSLLSGAVAKNFRNARTGSPIRDINFGSEDRDTGALKIEGDASRPLYSLAKRMASLYEDVCNHPQFFEEKFAVRMQGPTQVKTSLNLLEKQPAATVRLSAKSGSPGAPNTMKFVIESLEFQLAFDLEQVGEDVTQGRLVRMSLRQLRTSGDVLVVVRKGTSVYQDEISGATGQGDGSRGHDHDAHDAESPEEATPTTLVVRTHFLSGEFRDVEVGGRTTVKEVLKELDESGGDEKLPAGFQLLTTNGRKIPSGTASDNNKPFVQALSEEGVVVVPPVPQQQQQQGTDVLASHSQEQEQKTLPLVELTGVRTPVADMFLQRASFTTWDFAAVAGPAFSDYLKENSEHAYPFAKKYLVKSDHDLSAKDLRAQARAIENLYRAAVASGDFDVVTDSEDGGDGGAFSLPTTVDGGRVWVQLTSKREDKIRMTFHLSTSKYLCEFGLRQVPGDDKTRAKLEAFSCTNKETGKRLFSATRLEE
jgi:hypothetical protein